MFNLYYFDINNLGAGYQYVETFGTEQECNQKAFEDNQKYFRIELSVLGGSTVIYDSSMEQDSVEVYEA